MENLPVSWLIDQRKNYWAKIGYYKVKLELLPTKIHKEKITFEKPLYVNRAYKNYDLKSTEVEETSEQLPFKLEKNIVSTISVSRFGFSVSIKCDRS